MTSPFRVPIILLYHSVRQTAEGGIYRISITPERFERHIAFVTSHYRVVPMTEFLDLRQSRAKLQGVAAITFDDGYVDNLTTARAILAKYRAVATSFIPVGFVGRPHFWWDAMHQMSMAGSGCPDRARAALQVLFPTLSISAEVDEADWFRVWDYIRRRPLDDAYAAVTELSDRLQVDLTALPRPVTEGELTQFAQWPFDIGSHAISHRPLANLTVDDLRSELKVSREYLEGHTGQPVRLFSYPFGLFDHEVAQATRGAGYSCAVSLVRESRLTYEDPFDLPRLDGADDDVEGLVAQVNHLEQANVRSFLMPTQAPLPPSRSARLTESAVPHAGLFRGTPINRDWGWGKGTPLDRPFIEHFIKTHCGDIRGRVLEVKEPEYCRLYARPGAQVDILDLNPDNKIANIIDDLQYCNKIADNTYDCVLLTQVLQFVPDVDKALSAVARILRPGGILLVTVCGITQTGHEEEGAFHWAFFAAGLRHALARYFDPRKLVIDSHGNAGLAASFLMGLTEQQVPPELLSVNDPEYAIVITGRAVKPGSIPTKLTWPPAADKPSISVIIPMYNAAGTIREALHSVSQQTEGIYEVLVVDDGSTDGSREVATEIAKTAGGVVRILEHPGRVNRGLSLTRNLALQHAAGEFIVFLDADDTIHPEKFAHDLAILRAHPEAAAIVGRALWWWDGVGLQNATLDSTFAPADRVVFPPEFFDANFQEGTKLSPPCVHSWMVRKSAIDRIDPFDPQVLTYEDQKFLGELSYRFPIYVASTCLCEYRRKESSLWADALATGSDALAKARFAEWRAKLTKTNARLSLAPSGTGTKPVG